MSTEQRRAGLITFKVSGEQYDAKGTFTYNLGAPLRETILGADRVHGFRETVQEPMIEGEITDRESLDVAVMLALEDETVTLEVGNGKVITLRNAWFAGEGAITTEEAAIPVKFVGKSAEEVR